MSDKLRIRAHHFEHIRNSGLEFVRFIWESWSYSPRSNYGDAPIELVEGIDDICRMCSDYIRSDEKCPK